MPTQWILDLTLTAALSDDYRYDVLHGIACAFFEQPVSDHDAEHKPFAVRLSAPTPTGARLELAWLPDTPPPATAVPTTLRLGPNHVDVTAFHVRKLPLADLGAESGTGRARYRTLSPAKYRHHGRDYPLPDPYLTYSGLIRRFLTLVPEIPEPADAIRELPRSVVVYGHDIRTQAFTWHGRRSAGFVGWVDFGLPHGCSPHARRLFAAVNDLAAIAGIGHGTTHGLGAVEIESRAVPPAAAATRLQLELPDPAGAGLPRRCFPGRRVARRCGTPPYVRKKDLELSRTYGGSPARPLFGLPT